MLPIDWDGYDEFKLFRLGIPADGDCLFHAIARAFFNQYIDGCINRNEIVRIFRKHLAANFDPYYPLINNGNTAEFAKEVPEFELDVMKHDLGTSGTFLGYGYIHYISMILGRDIYILNGHDKDIYISDDMSLNIQGDRPSIVLYFENSHYEVVGMDKNNHIGTYFKPTNAFIRFLYNKICKRIQLSRDNI